MPDGTNLAWRSVAFGAAVGCLLLSSIQDAIAQDAVDEDARSVLAAMSTFLGELEAYSVRYEADFDVVGPSGQKLKFVSSGEVLVQRPNKLRATRTGTIADVDFILDGQVLTIFGSKLNGYVQLPASSIDEAINVVREDIGFEAPGADFLGESPFNEEATDIVSGVHVGMTDIGGVAVHHLAFRGEQVDWQLWVQDGDEPLPIRYVITSKWVAGAPEYSLQLSDWDLAPAIDPARFTFTPPDNATKFSSITVDGTGQIVNTWE